MTFTYILGTCFTELTLCFHKSPSLTTQFFPAFRETVYSGRVKLFAEVSELSTHVVFLLVVSKKPRPVSASIRAQRDGNQRVLNWDCRDEEGEQSTPLFAIAFLVHRPVCGLALSCRTT